MTQTPDRLLWLNQAILSVDVETETDAARDYPEILHSIKKFGLSALSPITDIALHSAELGTIHLNMRGFNPYRNTCNEEASMNWQFVYNVLCRRDVLIIGHNVIFDLRVLGVQYNAFANLLHEGRENKDLRKYWKLPLGAKVWCTEIIAKRMLLGEQFSKKSGFFDKFDILSLAKRLEISVDTSSIEMIAWMKTQRADLNNLAQTLAELPRMKTVALEEIQHEVWTYLGGYVPPNRPDLLSQAASRLLTDYVGFDAKIAYEIYEKELAIAEQLATGDVKIGKLKLLKYPELTQRDILEEFNGHLDYWTRYLRLSSNRAVHGLRLNRRYLREKKIEFKREIKENEEIIMGAQDPHEPYPEFEEYASQFIYYEMLLGKAAGVKSYNQNIAQEWVFWKPVQIYPALLEEALTFPQSFGPEDKRAWLDWMKAEPYAKFTDAKKLMPPTRAPSFSLEAWIKRNCYHEYAEPLASLLAKTKADWLRAFYTTTRYDLKVLAVKYWKEHPLKTPAGVDLEAPTFEQYAELGKREYYRKMSNSKKWIPYFIYCVSGAPLPSSESLLYEEGLVTNSLRKRLAAYEKDNYGNPPDDYQMFVVACHLEQQAFSYGKKAQDFFMKDPAYAEVLKPLRILSQSRAYLTRFNEIEQHAFLDNHVHSQITPDAKTGRGASKNPNLQNVAMNTKDQEYPSPYPGLFIAPKGMWLGSKDYSNAEINMSNMIAKDDAGAAAAVDNDYHTAMAEVYFPKKWSEAEDFPKLRKALRSDSKRVTFGTAYGSGVAKTALMMRSSLQDARTVLDNKKRVLWRTEEQKKLVEENARKRFKAGYLPVFAQLWSKERVQVDRTNYNNHYDIVGYPIWNYLNQGGVTAMIRRADVLISEMLEREGYKTFVQQDIHDELLFAYHIEEYMADDRELPRRILEIMDNIVPDVFLERTTPKTHFIAEFGPENAKKWGYHPSRPYPFPLDEFITQWGVHKLPEGAVEALGWVGPKHLGWTLEQETNALQAKRIAQAALIDGDGDVGQLELGQEWTELQDILFEADLTALPSDQRKLVTVLLKPMKFVYETPEGGMRESDAMAFVPWMIASRMIFHRGKPSSYLSLLEKIKAMLPLLGEAGAAWQTKYQSLFEVMKE